MRKLRSLSGEAIDVRRLGIAAAAIISVSALAVVPLASGKYEIVATIIDCKNETTPGVCAVVHHKTRSERWLPLETGEWKSGIESMKGMKLVLKGDWNGKRFSVGAAPRVHRQNLDTILTDDGDIKKSN